jgi:hypothetical protein
MPRTAQCFTDHEPFRERSGIVSARGSHRVDVAAGAHQHDGLTLCMPEERDVLPEFGDRDAGTQIGTTELCRVCHRYSPEGDADIVLPPLPEV